MSVPQREQSENGGTPATTDARAVDHPEENPGGDGIADGGNGNGGDRRRQSRDHRFSGFSTASDGEFREILRERLAESPLAADYPDLFAKAPGCFVRWRNRFSETDPRLWRRLFATDKILKEFFEAVPVLDAVVKMIENDTRLDPDGRQSYTIIDLCSGKGYLGMILSEVLPPSKVFRIVLMDKAWPMRNAPVKAQHINWDHIYGTYDGDRCIPVVDKNDDDDDDDNNNHHQTDVSSLPTDEKKDEDEHSRAESPSATTGSRSYYDSWPIPIDTSKQDLKSSRQLSLIRKHYLSNPSEHPVILLAIHLCGTLSLRAVELFNTNPSVKFFALKPCCLPGMIHAKRREVFSIGSHAFDAEEVCVHGKWKKNRWENGPPRSHLRKKFKTWSRHLYRGIGGNGDDHDGGGGDDRGDDAIGIGEEDGPVRKAHAMIRVQHDGGFQNDFLFAERTPISSASVWNGLEPHTVVESEQ